jgi:hypothetical protein
VKTVTSRSSRISVTNCRPSSTVPTTSTPSTRNEGVGGLLTSMSRVPGSTSPRSATSIADPLVSASATPRRCVPSPNPSLADRYRPRFPEGSVTVPLHSLDLESNSEYTLSTPRSAPARGHSGVPNDSGVSSRPRCFIPPPVFHPAPGVSFRLRSPNLPTGNPGVRPDLQGRLIPAVFGL